MRKPLLITIAIVAALAIITWLFSSRSGKKDLSPWQLIPPNALAVIETQKPRILQQLNADSSNIVSLLIGNDTTKASSEPWLFSIQSLGNKTGTVVVLRKTSGASPLELARKIKGITINERTYEGVQINDINQSNQPWVSIAQTRGVWLVSHHSILIEEILRNQKSEAKLNFRNQHNRIFQLSNVKQDDGNLYINWPAFRDATSKNRNIDPILIASNLADAMLFDLRWTNDGNTLLLNGFATDSLENTSLLSLFKTQKPVGFGLRNQLPDRFRYFVHFGISNPTQWLNERNDMMDATPNISQQFDTLLTKTAFHTEEFFKALDNEIALVELTSGEHLIVAELKEITRATSEFNKVNAAHIKQGQYSHESYANEDIHVLKQSTLSQTLFWPIAFPASELYYTISNNLLVLSDGEQGIKEFIDGLSGEATLNKSLEWSKFLESTLQESNVSLFVSSASDDLFDGLRQPQKFSIQFYPLEGEYYTSAIMQFGKNSEKRTAPRSVKKGTDFGQTTSRLWTVRNHNDKSTEVLVLDASNRLHLVSKDQHVLWSTALPGPVQGDLYQVDLLKNGKLQYLFVAAGQLQAIDRLGRNVAGYPKALSMNDASYTSLIDYDKNRNYRLLMANTAGKIIVCDTEGKSLEGWEAKNLPRGFADAPTHFRIRQRDYYEATTVQGDVFLFSRRAEIVEGFPLALNVIPSGDVVSDGKNIVLVSEDGTVFQVNTSGKKVSENALLKKTPKALFRLVAATNDDNFIVVKREEGFITGFDQTGKQLFEVNNPASDNVQFSLYHAGDRDVLVVLDKDQNLFYACDLAGKMLVPQPLQATGLPVVSYSSSSKTIIFNVPDQTRLITVSATL
ncbi:MAG: hypothetical protein WDO14_20845 [Bacteroidota bacterium]